MTVHPCNPCPKCGAELKMGFGFVGGGYGPYEYCTNMRCDQFTKWQDNEPNAPLPEKGHDAS